MLPRPRHPQSLSSYRKLSCLPPASIIFCAVAAVLLAFVVYSLAWEHIGVRQTGDLCSSQPPPPGSSLPPLPQQPLQPLRPQGLEWLHIPKTGTSFGNTLILWACPELDPNQVWMGPDNSSMPPSCRERFRAEGSTEKVRLAPHRSLTDRTDDQLRRVVTMLRFPPTWLVSLYHHGQRSDARFHKLPPYQPQSNVTEADMCRYLETSESWSADRDGCMVKMVVGVPRPFNQELRKNMFTDVSPPTPAMTAEACRRVGLFAFVGITDYWDASICLFHAMHGGPMHPIELQNVRPGNYEGSGPTEVSCVNEQDMKLFGCALRLFRQRLAAHPHCMQHLPSAAKPVFAVDAGGGAVV